MSEFDIGFVTTAHYSDKLRKLGREYLESMVSSVEKNINFKYRIFVMDNESEIPFQSCDRYEVKRFENQRSGGLSRTWNFGVKLAYESGCKLVVISNDDVEFTKSINDLVEFCISNEDRQNSLIGPVSCGAFNRPQRSKGPGEGITDVTNKRVQGHPYQLNGFCQALHREFYEKFNVDGKLWNIDGTKNKWGGEEEDLHDRCTPLGLRSLIYRPWFVRHASISGWWPLHYGADEQ